MQHERKKNNQKLKKKSTNTNIKPEEVIQINTFFQTASDGIITIDNNGIIQSVNIAITRIFGYEEPELIGTNISILMPSSLQKGHNEYLKKYDNLQKSIVVGNGRELIAQKKDGTFFPIRLAVNQMQLSGGIYFTGILYDLSAQKASESAIKEWNIKLEKLVEKRTIELAKTIARLENANRQLEQENRDRKTAEYALLQQEGELIAALEKEKALNELKSRFVSMASHEFRTPLSSVLGAAELIEVYPNSEQQDKRQKNVNRIKNAVGTLTSILNDFLSLSKLEEGKLEQNPSFFFLNFFCQEVLDEVKGVLKSGQIIHHKGLKEDREIYFDKNFLKIILFNLITNAAKYSIENQMIQLNMIIDKETLIIEIKDRGLGIPLEDQDNLFERFFRAHNVENIQGTGLGLNIAKRYVDILGGKIYFTSKLGKGTTFFVELPIEKI